MDQLVSNLENLLGYPILGIQWEDHHGFNGRANGGMLEFSTQVDYLDCLNSDKTLIPELHHLVLSVIEDSKSQHRLYEVGNLYNSGDYGVTWSIRVFDRRMFEESLAKMVNRKLEAEFSQALEEVIAE